MLFSSADLRLFVGGGDKLMYASSWPGLGFELSRFLLGLGGDENISMMLGSDPTTSLGAGLGAPPGLIALSTDSRGSSEGISRADEMGDERTG